MKQRCNNPNSHRYDRYGGRGIKYCPEWETFAGFQTDMESSWFSGAVLDRIDSDGNYHKGNCRWATKTQSLRNRSNVRMTLEIANKIRELYPELNQYALAEKFDVDQSTVSRILNKEAWNG